MNATDMQLPSIATARLPQVYENAKTALAECSRIDECASWANKAEALASYAKQAGDDSLRKMADRIQARAIRRQSELLRQIPAQRGGDRGNAATGGRPPVADSRTSVARAAGLSEHQMKTAMRVGNVPAEEFERQVESDNPPTVTALAKQGTKPLVQMNGRDPSDFKRATQALGALRRFCEFATDTDPGSAARGMDANERRAARELVSQADAWLDRFVTQLGD